MTQQRPAVETRPAPCVSDVLCPPKQKEVVRCRLLTAVRLRRRKTIPGWPVIGPRFVKRKETDGSRRFASDDSLQPPDFFRRVITLQISLPPRRVRTDCSSTWYSDAQPWALEALPPHSILESQRWTLTNGFMTKALLRSQDQAPPGPGQHSLHSLLEMPSAQPGDLDSRPRLSSGGGSAPFLPSVCHDIRGRANMPAAGWVTESSAGWHAAGVLCPWVVVVCSSPLPPCA